MTLGALEIINVQVDNSRISLRETCTDKGDFRRFVLQLGDKFSGVRGIPQVPTDRYGNV